MQQSNHPRFLASQHAREQPPLDREAQTREQLHSSPSRPPLSRRSEALGRSFSFGGAALAPFSLSLSLWGGGDRPNAQEGAVKEDRRGRRWPRTPRTPFQPLVGRSASPPVGGSNAPTELRSGLQPQPTVTPRTAVEPPRASPSVAHTFGSVTHLRSLACCEATRKRATQATTNR